MAYLDRCGFAASFHQRRIGAILHSTFCRFRQPLHHPDDVIIGARCSKLEEDRFTMDYAVVSRTLDAVVAEGWGVIVSFDYARRTKTPIPEDVRRAIEAIEAPGPPHP